MKELLKNKKVIGAIIVVLLGIAGAFSGVDFIGAVREAIGPKVVEVVPALPSPSPSPAAEVK